MRTLSPLLAALLLPMALSSQSAPNFLAAVDGAGASGGVILEGGPFLPYSLVRATARLPGGFKGLLELEGSSWQGPSARLFTGRIEAWTEAPELLFYLDGDLRSLRLSLGDPASPGRRSYEFELPRSAVAADPAARLLASLPAPLRAAPASAPPDSLELRSGDAAEAALAAAGTAFSGRGGGAAMPVLALAGLLGALAAGLARSPRERRLCAIILALGAAALLWAVLPRGALLYRIALPTEPERGAATLSAERSSGAGLERVTWGGAARPSGLELLGMDAPPGSGIAPEEMAGEGDRVRFQSPPLVRGEGPVFRLESAGFVCAWVFHAPD